MGPAEPLSGELRDRIQIRAWSDVPNATFGIDPLLDVGIGRWAKHEPIHGLTQRAGVQTGEAPTDLFWVRAGSGTQPADITANHVVEFKGHQYRVVDTIYVGKRRAFTRITAKDLGAIA